MLSGFELYPRWVPLSRVKRRRFYRKSELQMFLLIAGGHIGAPKRYKGA